MQHEARTSETCPPHHWQVTTDTAGGDAHYHHVCLRCAAQKDVPVYGQPERWARPGPA